MYQDHKLLIGKAGDAPVYLYPSMANRHGLIAGATGTGKTVTLKVLAESFSDCGVPVFLADIKGDLAGMCKAGALNDSLQKRIDKLKLAEVGFSFHGYPTNYWDVYGENGMPLRTTVSEMGPLLLSKVLELNDTQSDLLTVLFKIADDEGLLLIDTKDLKATLQYVGEHAKDYSLQYGNIAKQSLAAIVRAVVALEAEGGDQFFGEPALNIRDWLTTDCDGRGTIQLLDCQKLIHNPTMYATFLLWMLSELFETLPEVGDAEKPKMVFFFDEAHLLFSSASKELLEKIAQVVKLIRSKGVGIYFITQNPQDIPDDVLGQLGNKIQHGLRAYTPKEQKAAKAAAQSFRENPALDTYTVLTQLGVGEALVSVLDEEGVPTMVQQCKILPPQSQMTVLDDVSRAQQIKNSLLYSRYVEMIDRDSAFEFLQRKALLDAETAAQAKAEAEAEKHRQKEQEALEKQQQKELAKTERAKQDVIAKTLGSALGTIGRQMGSQLGKQVGGSFGKKVGGNVGASLGRGILQTLFKK